MLQIDVDPPKLDAPVSCCGRPMKCLWMRPRFEQRDFVYVCEVCQARSTIICLDNVEVA
jgi:hypothetical protein